MKKFSHFIEARDHAAVIQHLRNKTVERGASHAEASAAKAKADELEQKHGSSIFSSKEAMRARWSKMASDARKKQRETKKERNMPDAMKGVM